MNVQGAVALITGGGGMLGAAAARRLLEEGVAHAVIADRAAGRAEALAEDFPDRVHVVPTDVTVEADVVTAVDAAAERGPLRVVVNAAGAGFVQRTLGRDGAVHDLGSFRGLIELNLIGTFAVMSRAAAVMAQLEPLDDGERGVIVNVSSLAGLEGSAGQIAYGTSKAGVAGMTLPAARDLAPVGVRVLCIAPGGMDDGRLAAADNHTTKQLLSQVPHPKRMGTPDDFALLVCQLVQHPYLNGQVVRLDGGARLGLKF